MYASVRVILLSANLFRRTRIMPSLRSTRLWLNPENSDELNPYRWCIRDFSLSMKGVPSFI
jgi:hypothetical protein